MAIQLQRDVHLNKYVEIDRRCQHKRQLADLLSTPERSAFWRVLRAVPFFSTGDRRLMLELHSLDCCSPPPWHKEVSVSSVLQFYTRPLRRCWGCWCGGGSCCQRGLSGSRSCSGCNIDKSNYWLPIHNKSIATTNSRI